MVLAGLIVIPAGPRFGQATKYLDEQGNSHWVQGPGWVPERNRDTATQPTLPNLLNGKVIRNDQVRDVPSARPVLPPPLTYGQMVERAQRDAQVNVKHYRMTQEALQSQQQTEAAWASARWGCLSFVQKRYKSFDAVVSGPGRMQMFGTSKARWAFTKCMSESGQPVE